MKTILVPVDFSPATEAIVRVAESLAPAFGARIVFSHVVRPLGFVDELPADPGEIEASRCLAARNLLETLRLRCVRAGLTVETRQFFGHPGRELAAEMLRIAPDFVVIGSHGRSRLRDLVLGSTAAYLLRHATAPVLVVPVPANPAAVAPVAETMRAADP